MFSSTRKMLIALGVIAGFAAAGAALAGAATKTTSSSSERPQRPPQKELTGDAADKVKAAAAARVSGGTVLRVEGGGPDGSAYHAHVRRSDGRHVVVLVNASFEATAVQTRPARPAGDRGRGRHGPGCPGGRERDTAPTGDAADTVKAAAAA